MTSDGCLFGENQPSSFDRVYYFVVEISFMMNIYQILVDVPCASDRHSLTTAFNIFSKKRVQERVELPLYQQKLLE